MLSRFRIDCAVYARYVNFAGVWTSKAGEDVDRRGLAGAVGPEKTEQLALMNAESDGINGSNLAETFGKSICLDCFGFVYHGRSFL